MDNPGFTARSGLGAAGSSAGSTEGARIVVDPAFRVGPIDPRLFGSFVEHLGRCVYGGIFEPDHPDADEEGFRRDVLGLTRELGVTTVRYPGGNFVSGYRWEDGVGPRSERPERLELAWQSLETNQVGVDEFGSWCRKAGVDPMMAVNLGTRGVEAAAALLEYCNRPAGSYWADRRVANGVTEPHDVRIWCLGNEMDGPWQIGHRTASEYGMLASQTARAMRMIDPDLELVACGSSNRGMPTFASWEAEVLEHTYDDVDYLSLHSYYRPNDGDLDSFLASAVDMDAMIEEVVATSDFVKAKRRKATPIHLSFDEWNVWYHDPVPGFEPWTEAPAIAQDTYCAADAVVVGSLLGSLLRHADRVKMACFAQLVNVIAPMMTENGGPSWRQTTFYPMRDVFAYARGDALRVEPRSPVIETRKFGPVPQLDCAATLDEATGDLAVFAVNRSRSASLPLEMDLRAFGEARPVGHTVLTDADPLAVNTKAEPDRVVPGHRTTPVVEDGVLRAELPPMSWNVLRVATAPGD